MTLLFIKLFIAMGAVIGLSVLAERAGPRIAGLLSGYPINTAMILCFFALEQGAKFAADSAVYSMPGVIATLFYLYAYSITLRVCNKLSVWAQMTVCTLVSLGVFLIVSFGFTLVTLSLWQSALLMLLAILAGIIAFRRIENIGVLSRKRISKYALLLRAFIAAVIVLSISLAASFVGPRWAGVLSGFPVSLFPIILILHAIYGPAPVQTIIRNFPRGVGALWIYVIIVVLTYATIGILIGTVLAFAAATIYLALYACVGHYLAAHLNKPERR